MRADASIAVLIPAYDAAGFISQTLESLASQSFPDFQAVVSVDGQRDATAEICHEFAARDPRFSVSVNQSTVGWIANANRLLDTVASNYFMLLPHDDLLERNFLEEHLRALEANARAVCAYCDLVMFGEAEGTLSVEPPAGTALDRMAWFLAGSGSAVAMRGLIRGRLGPAGLRFREVRHGGFLADTVFVAEMLAAGPAIRIAAPLYRKRIQSSSLRAQVWQRLDAAERRDAARAHAHSLVEMATARSLPPGGHDIIATIAVLRALTEIARGSKTPAVTHDWPSIRRAGLAAGITLPTEMPPHGAVLRAVARLASVEGYALVRAGRVGAASVAAARALTVDPVFVLNQVLRSLLPGAAAKSRLTFPTPQA